MVTLYVSAYTYVVRCYKARHRWSSLILKLTRQWRLMLLFSNTSRQNCAKSLARVIYLQRNHIRDLC